MLHQRRHYRMMIGTKLNPTFVEADDNDDDV